MRIPAETYSLSPSSTVSVHPPSKPGAFPISHPLVLWCSLQCRGLGSVHFITKPSQPRRLLPKLASFPLHRSCCLHPRRQWLLGFGNLPSGSSCSRCGQKHRLRPPGGVGATVPTERTATVPQRYVLKRCRWCSQDLFSLTNPSFLTLRTSICKYLQTSQKLPLLWNLTGLSGMLNEDGL